MAPFWLYRSVAYTVRNHHRAYWSTTWVSTDPEVGGVIPAGIFADFLYSPLLFPLGVLGGYSYLGAGHITERLWPTRGISSPFTLNGVGTTLPLNSNAPEAALRLQRVGAGGSTAAVGRICFPILHDSWFTDLPRRRRVDVATLQPLITANLDSYPNTGTFAGRTLTNVIFHRRSMTWTPVTHHVLQVNPVRIWQRWRTFTPAGSPVDDAHYVPDEVY